MNRARAKDEADRVRFQAPLKERIQAKRAAQDEDLRRQREEAVQAGDVVAIRQADAAVHLAAQVPALAILQAEAMCEVAEEMGVTNSLPFGLRPTRRRRSPRRKLVLPRIRGTGHLDTRHHPDSRKPRPPVDFLLEVRLAKEAAAAAVAGPAGAGRGQKRVRDGVG